MFQTKNSITSILAVIFLLVGMPCFAQNENANPLTGRSGIDTDDESAESIRWRSGQGDPIAGREKSQLCQGCHGEFGISTEPKIPKLAGQYGKYISKQVRNYQSGVRTHQIMNAMAGTINDEDLADISAYFASQRKMKGSGPANNPLGKEYFLNGDPSNTRIACVNCHGKGGKGLEPKISMFPVIGGQHKDYLIKQLKDFRDGDRTNSPNNIMNRIANSLSDSDIESLAEYISQL